MDSTENPARSRWRGKATAIGLAAAGAVAGGVLASTLSASAADNSSAAPAASGYGAPQAGQLPGGGPGRGSMGAAPVRPDETRLTGSDAATAKAAALQAVPGGTVYRVETDAGDAAYEAHMTKSDGTLVTVKMDKSFAVTAVEDGMGKGDPRPGNATSN
jgi:hypothetical protein